MNLCPLCDGEGVNLDMARCIECDGTGFVKEFDPEEMTLEELDTEGDWPDPMDIIDEF